MSIKEFLLARIAEDEALAGAAAISMHGERHTERWDYSSYVLGAERDSTEAQDMFIREFWPARVLAECAAKRAIIADRERIDRNASDTEWAMGYSDANYSALHALAAVYSDHPDYRSEWAA